MIQGLKFSTRVKAGEMKYRAIPKTSCRSKYNTALVMNTAIFFGKLTR